MAIKNSHFAKLVSSRWSGYLPLWGIATFLWCFNSFVLLGLAQTPHNYWAAFIANLVSALLLIALGLVWSRLISRVSGYSLMPLWAVFLAGAVVGITKGVSTYGVFWSLSGVPWNLGELVLNSLPAILTGLWLLPAFAVMGALREEFALEREALISAVVTHELSSATVQYIDQDVTEFVTRAKHQLENAGESSGLFQLALVDLAEREVRPMSHRLWEQEESKIRGYRFRDLAVSALTVHNFPAFWTSASLFISLLMLQVPLVGFVDALIRSALQSVIAFVFLFVGRLLPWKGRLSGPVIFLFIPVLIVAFIEFITLTFIGPLPGVTAILADSSLYIGLVSTSLIFGIVISAWHSHGEMKGALEELRAQEISTDANHVIYLLRRRETAEFLHGYVQNQLLNSALKLKDEAESLSSIQQNVTRILSSLEAGLITNSRDYPTSIENIAKSLKDSWAGIMDVDLVKVGDAALSLEELDIIDRLTSEFAANSRRHGNASTLHITVTTSENAIELHAVDNGSLAGQGPPGLGTALLHSLSSGRWSREVHPDTAETIVTCSITRSPNVNQTPLHNSISGHR